MLADDYADMITRARNCARATLLLHVDTMLDAAVHTMRERQATDLQICEMLVLVAEASTERELYAGTRALLERRGATLQ